MFISLKDFLSRHRAEVKDVILTEYDQEAHIRSEKKAEIQVENKRRERSCTIYEIATDPAW